MATPPEEGTLAWQAQQALGLAPGCTVLSVFRVQRARWPLGPLCGVGHDVRAVVTDKGVVELVWDAQHVRAVHSWGQIMDIVPEPAKRRVSLLLAARGNEPVVAKRWSIDDPEGFAMDCQKMRFLQDGRRRHGMIP